VSNSGSPQRPDNDGALKEPADEDVATVRMKILPLSDEQAGDPDEHEASGQVDSLEATARLRAPTHTVTAQRGSARPTQKRKGAYLKPGK
jgi:hypothetical protein